MDVPLSSRRPVPLPCTIVWRTSSTWQLPNFPSSILDPQFHHVCRMSIVLWCAAFYNVRVASSEGSHILETCILFLETFCKYSSSPSSRASRSAVPFRMPSACSRCPCGRHCWSQRSPTCVSRHCSTSWKNPFLRSHHGGHGSADTAAT